MQIHGLLNKAENPKRFAQLPEQQIGARKGHHILGYLKWHQKPTISQMNLSLCLCLGGTLKIVKFYKAEEIQNQINNQEDCSHNKMAILEQKSWKHGSYNLDRKTKQRWQL